MQAAAPPPITTSLSVGFYTPNSQSRAALEAEWSHLTHLAPVWMQLDHEGQLQVVTAAAAGVGTQADNQLVAAAHLHGVRVWPVLQNLPGGDPRQDRPEGAGVLPSTSMKRSCP